MKRIIALFVVLSMMLALVPSVMAEDATYTTVEKETVDRVFGLGLIPHTTRAEYIEDAPFTRGELAWLIDTLYNYQANTDKADFTWQFYGDGSLDNDELKTPPATLEPRFNDVLPSYWAYDIVEAVVGAGLMNGISATEFLPDGTVTVEQLVKTLVVLLGYDSKAQYFGGYPSGYMKVAADLGLLSGIKSTGVVTNGTLVRMLDNCLDVRLMKFDGIVSDGGNQYIVNASSDDTFLTGILGLNRIEGVMTDNSVTGILGDTRVEENQFVVDNVLLKAYADVASNFYGFIGREVECYFVADQTSKKRDVIIYAALTGGDKATTITPDDFAGYNNGTISYYVGDKVKNIKLSDLYALIYNGKALTSYDNSVFDVSDGDITVVESNGGTDVVIINSYESWYVSAVDYGTMKVFNYMANLSGFHTIDFDDDYKYITIIKADGTPGTIADILPDSVIDVAANGDTITVRISDTKEVCVINTITTTGGDYILSTADRDYEIAKSFFEYEDRLDFKIGDEVTVYLNTFGKIGWMVYGAAAAFRTGYIMNAATEMKDMSGRAVFMIYDATDKAAVTYYANLDKVRVSDSYGKESDYKNMTNLIEKHGSYRGIVRYLLNANREITYLEFPIADVRNQNEEKLTLIAETTEDDRFRYNNFGGKAISDSATIVFCVDPDNLEEEIGYDVRTVSATFSNEKEYVTKCYATRLNSRLAEFIVYETKSKAATITYDTGINFAIVKGVSNVYDDVEAESVKAIKAFTSTISTSTTANSNNVLKLASDCKIYTPISGEFKGEIEPGDFIFYGTNAEGYVNEIRVLWDQNGVNPDSPNGAPGALVDSKGFYGTGDDTPTFASDHSYTGDPTQIPNPMTLATASGVHKAKTSKGFSSGPLAIQYGFLARNNYGALEITSQDVTVEEYDETGLDGKHIVRIWTVPTNVIVVNLSGKNNVDVVQGTSTALKPFRTKDAYNQDCSRMIVFSNYAMMSKLIVFNGYFE